MRFVLFSETILYEKNYCVTNILNFKYTFYMEVYCVIEILNSQVSLYKINCSMAETLNYQVILYGKKKKQQPNINHFNHDTPWQENKLTESLADFMGWHLQPLLQTQGGPHVFQYIASDSPDCQLVFR